MTTTDGLTDFSGAGLRGDRHMLDINGFGAVTLSGNVSLTDKYANVQRLDCGGTGRTLTLPDAADSEGMWFDLINWSDGAEDLTVNLSATDGGTTLVTVSQNEKCTVRCDGSSWERFGLQTINIAAT